MEARIIPIRNGAPSRSSVREDDGVVVFAMPAALVRVDGCGFSCLLWAPVSNDLERLRHCRLAVRDGMAEGFLLYGEAAKACEEEMLSLRILKVGKEYWARWGDRARDVVPPQYASVGSVRL
jgi:hypothetical protein